MSLYDSNAAELAPTISTATSSHAFASSLPRESGNRERQMHDRRRIAGNDRREIGRNIRCEAFTITQAEYTKRVQRAMHEEAGDGPGKAKRIAVKLECNEKTVQNWLDGKTTPSGILDRRALNKLPIYAALMREIAAMELDLDPRLQAKYQELHRLTLELANGGA